MIAVTHSQSRWVCDAKPELALKRHDTEKRDTAEIQFRL